MTDLYYDFVLGMYLQPLMRRAQMTWFSLARQTALLTSVLGHGGRETASRRPATSLTGFPAEILQAKFPAETAEQPHQMLLWLCRAPAGEALGHLELPPGKPPALTTGLCCIPAYLQGLVPTPILMSADVKISNAAGPVFI